MDTLPLHPKLVHLPIALALLLPLLASAFLLAWWRGWLPKRSWLAVVLLQAVLLGTGLWAIETGEQDEERVERIVAERVLERHEEAAAVFVWTAAGVLGLACLPFLLRRGPALGAGLLTVAGTAVVLVLGIRVGQAGGELVYRHGAADAWRAASAAPVAPLRSSDDDDH